MGNYYNDDKITTAIGGGCEDKPNHREGGATPTWQASKATRANMAFCCFMGLSICQHFEFNYILNLYVLSMYFVRYHN